MSLKTPSFTPFVMLVANYVISFTAESENFGIELHYTLILIYIIILNLKNITS
jgi:hypothetical protein